MNWRLNFKDNPGVKFREIMAILMNVRKNVKWLLHQLASKDIVFFFMRCNPHTNIIYNIKFQHRNKQPLLFHSTKKFTHGVKGLIDWNRF